MFANVAGSYLWGWTAVGAALELLFQIIPVAIGLRAVIDAGLARVFFSWTLHAIVYFWLMPTYIAYYTIAVPRAIGGKLYSDTMGRLAFILFLVVAMPIGLHRHIRRPAGGGRLQVPAFGLHRPGIAADLAHHLHHLRLRLRSRLGAARRARPARLASIAGAALAESDHAGGERFLPSSCWASAAAGGLINMSYQLDTSIHNTQWITGAFPI